MASGAPDWQTVVTLVEPSLTSGAPDWERTVVGPGGTPIGGGGLSLVGTTYLAANRTISGGSGIGICDVTGCPAGYLLLEYVAVLEVTNTGAAAYFQTYVQFRPSALVTPQAYPIFFVPASVSSVYMGINFSGAALADAGDTAVLLILSGSVDLSATVLYDFEGGQSTFLSIWS